MISDLKSFLSVNYSVAIGERQRGFIIFFLLDFFHRYKSVLTTKYLKITIIKYIRSHDVSGLDLSPSSGDWGERKPTLWGPLA
jgi:hypothetical protein